MAKQKSDMGEDARAMQEAMAEDRKKNPPLGSPAWARQQAKKKKGGR